MLSASWDLQGAHQEQVFCKVSQHDEEQEFLPVMRKRAPRAAAVFQQSVCELCPVPKCTQIGGRGSHPLLLNCCSSPFVVADANTILGALIWLGKGENGSSIN